jgi:hypothetical protein
MEFYRNGQSLYGIFEFAINATDKLGERSLASVLGHRPFFGGNRADVHCIIKAEVLNEYTKMRGVNETITTCLGTAV